MDYWRIKLISQENTVMPRERGGWCILRVGGLSEFPFLPDHFPVPSPSPFSFLSSADAIVEEMSGPQWHECA